MKRTLLSAVVIAAALATTQAKAAPALYLLGGGDLKVLTNQDANNYFNLPGGTLGPQGYGSTVGHLGLQLDRYFAVEASINRGLYRQNEVAYDNSGVTTRRVKTDWQLTTYSVTPGFTWASPYAVSMLGFRIGQANLAGHVKDDAFGVPGDYDQQAQIVDYGVLFRSSAIIVEHLSVGLEFGYDWTVFKDIKNQAGSGAYDPVHSPERNVSTLGHNGDQTQLDFSGGHVAIVVGLWTGPVVRNDDNSATNNTNP